MYVNSFICPLHVHQEHMLLVHSLSRNLQPGQSNLVPYWSSVVKLSTCILTVLSVSPTEDMMIPIGTAVEGERERQRRNREREREREGERGREAGNVQEVYLIVHVIVHVHIHKAKEKERLYIHK